MVSGEGNKPGAGLAFTPFGANAVVSLHLPELRFRHYSVNIISIIINAAETALCSTRASWLKPVLVAVEHRFLVAVLVQYVGSIKRPRRESQNSFRSFPGWICLRDGLSLGKFMLGSALLHILSQFLESHLVVDRHNAHRALQCLDEGIDCSSGTLAVFVSLLNRLLAPTGTDQCPHEHRVRSEMWA